MPCPMQHQHQHICTLSLFSILCHSSTVSSIYLFICLLSSTIHPSCITVLADPLITTCQPQFLNPQSHLSISLTASSLLYNQQTVEDVCGVQRWYIYVQWMEGRKNTSSTIQNYNYLNYYYTTHLFSSLPVCSFEVWIVCMQRSIVVMDSHCVHSA